MNALSIYTNAVTGSLTPDSITRAQGRRERAPNLPNSNPTQISQNEDAVKVTLSDSAQMYAAATAADKAASKEKMQGQKVDAESSPTEDNSSEVERQGEERPAESKDGGLSDEEKRQVQELKSRDQEVRAHEQAHMSAGGQYVSGGAQYSYKTGPDGKQYAVGGEVSIDVGKEANPQATVAKMQTVKRAALAPAKPSGQDRQVAAQAQRTESQARSEIAKEHQEEVSQNNEVEEKAKSDSQAGQVVDKPERVSRDEAMSNSEETQAVVSAEVSKGQDEQYGFTVIGAGPASGRASLKAPVDFTLSGNGRSGLLNVQA